MKLSTTTAAFLALILAVSKPQQVWSIGEGTKEQNTMSISQSAPGSPDRVSNIVGFNGPVRFMWSASEFCGAGLCIDTYTITLRTLGAGGGNLYQVGVTGNQGFTVSNEVGENLSDLDYEVELDCTNPGLGVNICSGTFTWALVDCGCGPGEVVLSECTFNAIGTSQAAICGAPTPPPASATSLSTEDIKGRWVSTGQSGPDISFSTTFGTSTTEGESFTEEQSMSVTATITAGITFSAPDLTGGPGASLEVSVSGTAAQSISNSVESSLTVSEETTFEVSSPDTSLSATGSWFLFQWVMTQEADAEGGVGFFSATQNYVFTESGNQVPQCPLNFCAELNCQTCLAPFESLEAEDAVPVEETSTATQCLPLSLFWKSLLAASLMSAQLMLL